MSRSTIPNSLVADWFNVGKECKQYTVESHSFRHPHYGVYDDDQTSTCTESSVVNSEECGARYAHRYQTEEANLFVKDYLESEVGSTVDVMSSLHLDEPEELSSMGDVPPLDELQHEHSVKVYKKYKSKAFGSSELKIASYKEKIVKAISCNRVTVIRGSTGSGKTTQVPQYILEHCMNEGKHCNIVVTQPRRIAAMSIARRVCDELGDLTVGELVGYHVGLENVTSEDTHLTFLTTGVLLQRLVSAKHTNDYTHIVLDEIHERDQDMDFVLLIVRKLTRTVSRNTKVILMSATVDADKFASYFSVPLGLQMVSAPVLGIEGAGYQVHEFWIDQLVELGQLPEHDIAEPKFAVEAINLAVKLIFKFDEIEILEQKQEGREFPSERGTVLMFLPGLEEINAVHRALPTTVNKWKLIKLHSSITSSEQNQVFEKPAYGYRKIIIATNIAESSITVPDIKYVIDFCLTKNLVCDTETNYTWLRLEWASKSNLIQRRGRAGRVSDGRIYRMITSKLYKQLEEYSVPEMMRCPLDKIVLHTKMLDIGEPKAIIALAMDPPDLSNIERTILTLMQVGALAAIMNERDIISSTDGDLTFVGRVIAKLPIDVHLGKLLILGYLFGCLENCIIIAAGLSKKSIFSKPSNDYLGAYAKKLTFAHGSFSDCIAIVNAYQAWKTRLDSGFFESRQSMKNEERAFGKRVGIEIGRLNEVSLLVNELTRRLEAMDICVPHHGRLRGDNQKDKEADILVLKLAIAGAFYPNYFMQSSLDEKTIVRSLNGKDPKCHVVLSNLPMHQGILYEDQLFDGVFGQMLNPDPHPEHDHTRLFVRLSSTHISPVMKEVTEYTRSVFQQFEGIAPGVYLAVKMRLLRIPIILSLYPPEEAARLMGEIEREREEQEQGSERKKLRTARMVSSGATRLEQTPLPNLQDSTIALLVTSVEDCGKFWACGASQDDVVRMNRIRKLIDKVMAMEVDSRPSTAQSISREGDFTDWRSKYNDPLTPGRFCLAPFKEQQNTEFYRARIESMSGNFAEVFFVDYGNKSNVAKSVLRNMEIEACKELMSIPMQAFECELSNLGPCAKKCPSGTWSEEAKNFFTEYVRDRTFIGRVYSVVYGVIHLELIYKNRSGKEISLNDVLKTEGFAACKEEGYLSKQNNELRKQAYSAYFMSDTDAESSSLFSTTVPKGERIGARGSRKIYVHGPSSPLEMSFMGITRGMTMRGARIEPDSVNSVTLDSEPQDTHARLLVASNVNLNSTGDVLTARNTTLMPNFHGLLSLAVLLFSPQVELRADKDRRRYTGALCGLGYEGRTGRPLYGDHDIEIVFDTNITDEDIKKINYTRMVLNLVLGFKGETNQFLPDQMDNAQKRVQENLLKLFTKERESVELIPFSKLYRWGARDPRFELKPVIEGLSTNQIQVLALIYGIQLEKFDKMDHIRYLHSKANESQQSFKQMCELCHICTYSPRNLLQHLTTRHHKELELSVSKSSS